MNTEISKKGGKIELLTLQCGDLVLCCSVRGFCWRGLGPPANQYKVALKIIFIIFSRRTMPPSRRT